jgi:hypothetical protein
LGIVIRLMHVTKITALRGNIHAACRGIYFL